MELSEPRGESDARSSRSAVFGKLSFSVVMMAQLVFVYTRGEDGLPSNYFPNPSSPCIGLEPPLRHSLTTDLLPAGQPFLQIPASELAALLSCSVPLDLPSVF